MDITDAKRISTLRVYNENTTFPSATDANFGHGPTEDDTSDISMSRTVLMNGGNEPSQLTSVTGEELTPLEYARLNGLSVDFTSNHPLQLCATLITPEHFIQELEDPKGVFQLDPSIHFLHPERLEILKETRTLIQSVLIPHFNPFLEALPVRASYSKSFRLEVPLLTTDNELDVRNFGQLAVPNFKNETFAHENINIENDEGLEWPNIALDLPQKYQHKIESEKLEMDVSATEYLLSVVRATPVEEGIYDMFETEKKRSKVRGTSVIQVVSRPDFIQGE
jgi:hypothetical protein